MFENDLEVDEDMIALAAVGRENKDDFNNTFDDREDFTSQSNTTNLYKLYLRQFDNDYL
jgi:hypothetical protein